MSHPDPGAVREHLIDPVREALDAHPAGARSEAARLAHLLAAREQFEAAVGEPPGGTLTELPTPFDGVTFTGRLREALSTYRSSLDEVVPEAIGEGYATALSADGRSELGQYFTPPPVADGLIRWAIGDDGSTIAPPRVLDPAVGTGTFPIAALRQLTDLRPGVDSTVLLDRLVGIDVDAAAVHLAGLRLAAEAGVPTPDSLSLHHGSFFDYEPAGWGSDATAGDGAADDRARAFSSVDAVVGNPPFIRAADLQPNAEHYRKHLAAYGSADETPWLNGDGALSRRSDAYVYFITHATRFLRPGGRLALVLPSKWLMSDYGEDLRRFIRERYRLHAVVGFSARAFGDALVDTVLLCAERDESAGGAEPLRFVRLDAPSDIEDLLGAIRRGSAGAQPGAGIVERSQALLTASGSLARYLEVPTELLALLDGPSFVRLDALAEISRGTMTGANRFFFVDDAVVERFGVEPRFLRPAVKSLRWVERPIVDETDISRQIVDVHGYVSAVRAEFDDGVRASSSIADALASDGHDGLAAYIKHAEREGWHEGRTCRSRPIWFDLGELPTPAAFVPKLLRERLFVIRNAADAVPSNAIDGLWPRSGVEADALLGALNSSAGRIAMEVTGRDEAGLLQLMTYETASMPTLDVRALSNSNRHALARAGETFARDPGASSLSALDEVVVDAFELPITAAQLREQAMALRRQRVDGGETVAVPLD